MMTKNFASKHNLALTPSAIVCCAGAPTFLLLQCEQLNFVLERRHEYKVSQHGLDRHHSYFRIQSNNNQTCLDVVKHSSLLSVFGLNVTSTYDSYLPLIFGKFALI